MVGASMKQICLTLGLFAILVFLLPALTAQEEKKAPEKTDKKEDDKKGTETKKPEPKKAPEKLVYGTVFYTKILNVSPNSPRDITIELMEKDPKKVYEFNVWQAERVQGFQRRLFDINNQKDL